MGYKKGLAIYIDILGTKEFDFCNLYKLNQIFHKELFKLKNKKTLCKKFVTSFSDCAYIIYTINEKDECDESVFRLFIHDSLDDLNYMISTIFVNGYMCRGGISYGELYFEENKKIVFGPAINEAYKLETEAMMPRIIFDDKLGAKLYEKENIVIKDKFHKLIVKDTIDNRYFLNYISLFSIFDDSDFDEGLVKEKIQLGDKEYSFKEYYDILISNSQKEIKETNDHSIISKHKWQLRYLKQNKKEMYG